MFVVVTFTVARCTVLHGLPNITELLLLSNTLESS